MAYRATVLPVMIASPGDVTEEREIIRSVIHDWNDVNADASKVVLNAVGWETHSSPELGGRAQELINSRLLDACDLLVGVFWTRLGTPTGDAKSGTVEEIERHIARGRPEIYFSSRPVAPQSVDPRQFAEVQVFQTRCKALGLIELFDDAQQFKEKFAKQLPLCLMKNEYLQSLVQLETPDATIGQEPSGDRTEDRLSDDAKKLLKAASDKDDGSIFMRAYMGGRIVQAGGQAFGGDRGRENAKWEQALKELEDGRLVVGRGHKGEIFELTHKGWAVADALKQA